MSSGSAPATEKHNLRNRTLRTTVVQSFVGQISNRQYLKSRCTARLNEKPTGKRGTALFSNLFSVYWDRGLLIGNRRCWTKARGRFSGLKHPPSCVHEGDDNLFSEGRPGKRWTDDTRPPPRSGFVIVSSCTDAFTADDGYPVIILYNVSGILVLLLNRHRNRPIKRNSRGSVLLREENCRVSSIGRRHSPLLPTRRVQGVNAKSFPSSAHLLFRSDWVRVHAVILFILKIPDIFFFFPFSGSKTLPATCCRACPRGDVDGLIGYMILSFNII